MASQVDGASWLDHSSSAEPFDILDPFVRPLVPMQQWVTDGLDWVVLNFRPVFQAIKLPVDIVLRGIEAGLIHTPAYLVILVLALLAWQFGNGRLAIGTAVSLAAIGAIGVWSEAMITLALVLTAVFFSIVVGLPIGIWLSRSDRAAAIVRPLLDAMQTTPAFVYLVPIVMLFGIGNVPGVIVTIIFALPPLIRLTNLGIRQVPGDLVEAARSFGASPSQLLFKVQMPLAMPTIMAGINQTLMMSLAMVVVASMISVGGLGLTVLRGIGRLDMGLATVGGLGIVLLAIVLDRITQVMGHGRRANSARHWHERGPIGWFRRLLMKNSFTAGFPSASTRED
ncbi:MAG: glycine betaine/L-proline ABC transporter permease ProW [Parvibaculaceae bacterium]